MNRWPIIAPVLKELITALAADPTRPSSRFSAEWHHGQRIVTSDQQKLSLLMQVTTIRTAVSLTEKTFVEEDSTDPEDEPYLGKLKVTTFSTKRVTLQLRTVVTQRTDDLFAFSALERVRDGLQWQSSIDTLAAVGVSVFEFGAAFKRNFVDKNRDIQSAILDVIFNCADVSVDPLALDWIEAVEVTSHTKDPAGVELPASLQMVDEIIPEDFVPPP